MNTQDLLQTQVQISAAAGPSIIGYDSKISNPSGMVSRSMGMVQTLEQPQPMGFESMKPAGDNTSEVTLGKNFVCDKFEIDSDTPPEDLYEDEFLTDLKYDKFVKIDDYVEMLVLKEDNQIIFRKTSPDNKLIGEYTMRLEPGELEQVIVQILSIKEGIQDRTVLTSNDVQLVIMKNCKEQFVATVSSGGTVPITMISTNSCLLRKMMYVIMYATIKPTSK